jgi:hypothetical protein
MLFAQRLDQIASAVEEVSNRLQALLAGAAQALRHAVGALLGPGGAAASQTAFNDFRHLGEAFSFQVPTAAGSEKQGRREAPGGVSGCTVTVSGSGSGLVSEFRFSRDAEMQTRQYSERVDLSQERVFAAELAALAGAQRTPGAGAVSAVAPRGAKKRVIVDSDSEGGGGEDEDEDAAYRPALKRQQPLPADLCVIPAPAAGTGTGAGGGAGEASGEASGRGAKRALGGGGEAGREDEHSFSISAIKRPFRDGSADTHLEAVEREQRAEDPLQVYAAEQAQEQARRELAGAGQGGRLEAAAAAARDAGRGRAQAPGARPAAATRQLSGAGGDSAAASESGPPPPAAPPAPPLEPETRSWRCRLRVSPGGQADSHSHSLPADRSEVLATVKW